MKWVIAGANLSVVICFTTCSRGTGWSDTKGFAVSCLKVAFLIKGAVIVGLTSYFCARDKWIALQTSRANTDSFVSFRLANCSTSTNCEWTRIHTLIRLAGFVIWAVVITSTIHYGVKGKELFDAIGKSLGERKKNLHSKHSWCGLPAQFSGHLQTGMWFEVLQMALLPQGSESHGSTQ